MSVAKVIEITSTSEKSFEDAIVKGIARADETLNNIESAWIKEQKVITFCSLGTSSPGVRRSTQNDPPSCHSANGFHLESPALAGLSLRGGAWKVRSSICSLPTSALRTKLRVGKAGGCMVAQDGSSLMALRFISFASKSSYRS